MRGEAGDDQEGAGGAPVLLGKLTPESRARIPLQEVKPIFLRPGFRDERRPRDLLNLAPAVEEALRRDPAAVFVDARAMPGGYEIAGRYALAEGRATVQVTIRRDEEEGASYTVEGSETDLAGLASRLAGDALRHALR